MHTLTQLNTLACMYKKNHSPEFATGMDDPVWTIL